MRDLMDLIIKENQDATGEGSAFFGRKGEAALFNIFVEMFIAGMETTSSSLLWTFLYMVHHQDIQAKVHAELDKVSILRMNFQPVRRHQVQFQVVGRDRLPSLRDQADLPFVNAVLHESFRITGLAYFHQLYPTVRNTLAFTPGFLSPNEALDMWMALAAKSSDLCGRRK